MGCKSVKTFYISENVNYIHPKAFYNCSSIEKIICENENPPTVSKDKFEMMPCYKITLYVPYESIDLYKNANGWKWFHKIYALSVDVEEAKADSKQNKGIKTIENGRIYIVLPDGTKYNTLGVKQ